MAQGKHHAYNGLFASKTLCGINISRLMDYPLAAFKNVKTDNKCQKCLNMVAGQPTYANY